VSGNLTASNLAIADTGKRVDDPSAGSHPDAPMSGSRA
jgi:hypothetical protein